MLGASRNDSEENGSPLLKVEGDSASVGRVRAPETPTNSCRKSELVLWLVLNDNLSGMLALPIHLAVAGIPNAQRSRNDEGGRKKIFRRHKPRNPSKSLDSERSIQGNESKFKILGIPFTPASFGSSMNMRWRLRATPFLESIIHGRSKRWMSGFVATLLAGSTSAACVGRTGSLCPECGVAADPWGMSRGRLRCRACEWETSLTAGTVFQDTRKPLRMWFLAMWFVTSQKNGVSALGLQRALGLGSCGDGLDLAAQAAAGDGPAWSGLSHGDGRSRRNLRRRPGRGQAWSGRRSQDLCRRGRRKERSGHRPDPPSAHQGCVGG